MEVKQEKMFFTVFPELKVSAKLAAYYKEVGVEHIVYKKDEKRLYVLIRSSHLLSFKILSDMEQQLHQYLHKSYHCPIIIIPRFYLSEQYDLETLLSEYMEEGIYARWHKESPIAYSALRKGSYRVTGDTVTFTLGDGFLSKNASGDIRKRFIELMKRYFDWHVTVEFEYIAMEDSRHEQEKEHRLGLELEQIEKMQVQAANEVAASSMNVENKGTASQEKMSPVNTSKQAAAQMSDTSSMGVKSSVNQKESSKSNGSVALQAPANSYSDRRSYSSYRRPKDDPDVIYGRNTEGELTAIKTITTEIGEVVLRGQVSSFEFREIRGEKTIFTFVITDFTSSIKVKLFLRNDMMPDLLSELSEGNFYLVKGIVQFDTYDKELQISSVTGIKKSSDFREKRMDTSMEKRVELHLHTVMSEMDSVVDIKEVIKTAKSWGHTAMAITDHGVLQAFPIANHQVDSKDDPFKIIYGVEGYFIDDLHDIVINSKGQSLRDSYVVFDLETTGFSSNSDRIIEIGAVKVVDGKEVDTFSEFVNPKRPIPFEIENLTHINDDMVKDAKVIEEVLPEFLAFCEGSVLVAHNAEFDVGFVEANCKRMGIETDFSVIDTVELAHILLPELGRFKLDTVAKHLKITLANHHRAVDDAGATAKIFVRFIEMLEKRDIYNVDELNACSEFSKDKIKKAPYYHGIILAKNEIGRVNLYHLVSDSHIEYFNKRPRIPKSLIQKYREGLILGSACEAGELFRAILHERGPEKIKKIVDFYDYLEIQPTGNNLFMLRDSKNPVQSVEDIEEMNKTIVKLGEEYNKPVVATCDVHFLNPEDSIYRSIIMKSKGFADADNQPPLYFRTTDEMLAEFAYLGSEKAREVVITNTNMIADMVEKISPVYPDKCPPEIPNSDETLTKICYDKAHEIYGPDLPDIVKERLERELNSIISNGFAVMYIIAQKLVWDSNDHGYLVGSRGSVGSSFVATMAGITEVNPLSAHYICPECYYVDFDSDEVKAFSGSSGCDMPDKLCPKCGHPLNKEGHDIPFETFLGFNGDKEPDIDLNFSGEYQGCAHKYTEDLFTKGHAFRAGTIGGVADKTAEGYVYKYFEDVERDKVYKKAIVEGKDEKAARKEAKDATVFVTERRCEMERLAKGCTGVKRTTGQHPGGIIVVPKNMEINMFTPIQHPANDTTTDIVTTHFEYHSIDHNLLKLDILGHDDPSMIRHLELLTDVDAKTIRFDDEGVMSLFHNTDALGITPEDIGGTRLGCLGIPEFGTDFAMQMVIDANPRSFSDLARISGLSHGTDVWLGNAQELIQQGIVDKLSDAICCRDDIMVFLIHKGLESGLAFTIMESVRKGKGVKDEWVPIMKEHGIPDWYIDSCRKIKYMFPKAHAVAYVMMAWRIAWFKINYPLEYYTAFFSIRAKGMNYMTMCRGREKLEYYMQEIRNKDKKERTQKDEDTLRDMRLVQEMYARGIEFMPIDLFQVQATDFQIIDGKIMPSLNTIDGMGDNAAQQIIEAKGKENKPYLSKEDLRKRAHIGQSAIEKLSEAGILDGLSETNQLSFDFL